jgi:hypothetical protein
VGLLLGRAEWGTHTADPFPSQLTLSTLSPPLPISSAQAKHVAEELKPHLDAFSSWDRMTTDYTQLLRASYKEFHHGNRYYKGKGQEFWDWLEKNYPTVFAVHFERAEGGREVASLFELSLAFLPADAQPPTA